MDHRYVIVKFNIYEFLLDYLPILVMVVFLAILYVKGKDVRENYHMKNSIIDNLDEKELKSTIDKWEPFH